MGLEGEGGGVGNAVGDAEVVEAEREVGGGHGRRRDILLGRWLLMDCHIGLTRPPAMKSARG